MAYRAEIQIGVVGIGQLGTLQKSLNQVSNAVDIINSKQIKAGFNVQNLNTYNNQLERAWQNINKAALGTQEELKAVEDLVRAKNNQIAAQQRLNSLIAKEEAAQRRIVATADAGFGVQGPAAPPVPSGARRGPSSPIGGGRDFPGSPGARSAAFENLALGAGFPLLFGGGAGQVAGGLLGSLVGTGFGGQILGSALGQILEDALNRIKEIGTAARSLDLDTLRDSAIYVNAELATTTRRLIEAGQLDQARARIATEVAAQTGILPQTLAGTVTKTEQLNNAWNQFIAAISGSGTVIGDLVIGGLTATLNLLTKIAVGANVIYQIISGKWITSITDFLYKQSLGEERYAKIKEKIQGITEEEQKRISTMVEVSDAQDRELRKTVRLNDLEARRTLGRTAAEKQINETLDKQKQTQEIISKYEEKRREILTKNAGTYSEEGKRQLKLLLDQNEAQKSQELRTTNIAANLRQQKLELEAITEKYTRINQKIDLMSTRRQGGILAGQLSGAISTEEASILSLQNEQVAVSERILARRQQIADLQRSSAGATVDELNTLQNELATLENRRLEIQVQVNRESLARITTDLENATAAANRALDYRVAGIQGELSLQQNQYQLLQEINNLGLQRLDQESQILRNTIESTNSVAVQQQAYTRLYQIAQERYNLVVANARIERDLALAQIEAAVQLQAIEVQRQVLKLREVQVIAKIAEATGQLTAAHRQAVRIQEDAFNLSRRIYDFAVRNADVQRRTADAVYQQRVEAANFALQMDRTAIASERMSSNISRAADAQGRLSSSLQASTSTMSVAVTPLQDLFMRAIQTRPGGDETMRRLAADHPAVALGNVQRLMQDIGSAGVRDIIQQAITRGDIAAGTQIPAFASGGFVARPTVGLVGEAGPEYIIPQRNAQQFAMNYMAGARGASAVPGSDGGGSPVNVTIQTGPVLEQNGQRYVSVVDLERAMQTMASSILGNVRTNSGRRYVGVG